MSDQLSKTPSPEMLCIASYFGTEIIEADDGSYYGIDHEDLNLSDTCQENLRNVMKYHLSFLDMKRDGRCIRIGTDAEKSTFHEMMAAAVRQLENELPKDRFVIKAVEDPFPNPFSE